MDGCVSSLHQRSAVRQNPRLQSAHGPCTQKEVPEPSTVRVVFCVAKANDNDEIMRTGILHRNLMCARQAACRRNVNIKFELHIADP